LIHRAHAVYFLPLVTILDLVVIPDIWELRSEGLWFQESQGKKWDPFSKTTREKRAGAIAQTAEHLSSKHKALNSNHYTTEKDCYVSWERPQTSESQHICPVKWRWLILRLLEIIKQSI
jgi:hypothetical protein